MKRKRRGNIKPTIREVAAYAGVSPTTVSHALSGRRPVSPETRDKIHEAMRVLNYEPSMLAQRLAGRPAQMITLIFPLVSGLFSSVEQRYIPAIGQPIAEAGYAFVVIYSPQMDMEQFRRFISSGVADGVILMQVEREDPRISLLQEHNLPFVMIGRPQNTLSLAYVDQDFETGISEAVRHLTGLGHHTIALLHYQEEQLGFVTRERGAFLALSEALHFTPLLAATDMSDASAYDAMRTLLAQEPRPTAAIIWNDLAVVGASRALHEQGLKIPEDFSLICYDRSPSLSMTSGPLTIIDTHIDQMGREAALMLLALLNRETQLATQVLLPSRLVLGNSTGPAPTRA